MGHTFDTEVVILKKTGKGTGSENGGEKNVKPKNKQFSALCYGQNPPGNKNLRRAKIAPKEQCVWGGQDRKEKRNRSKLDEVGGAEK